jgi:hypothetical protein
MTIKKERDVIQLPMTPSDYRPLPMPPPEQVKKGPPTKPLRVKVQTHAMISEISEATGKAVFEIIEELVAASLVPWHKAVQPQLRKVRDLAAKLSAAQAEARKAGG